MSLKFAVLGADHGGKAMAAHLGRMGFVVNLYNRLDVDEESNIDLQKVNQRGGIELEGAIEGFGKINMASSNIEEVTSDVDVIMVVTPAHEHKYAAEACAPHLQDGQIVLLNPGRTGGALEFKNILQRKGITANVKVAEAATLIYTCRSLEPTHVKVFSLKKTVQMAALPSTETENVLKIINKAYNQFTSAASVLETGLNNIGAIFHPAITLLNVAHIESTKGDFDFYIEGASLSVCKVIEKVDKERIEVAKALDVKATPVKEWLEITYGAKGKTLFEALQKVMGYRGIKAPPTLRHRYILEDVPTGLVPYASFGDMLRVPTPAIKTIINLASTMLKIDFWEEGRTVERLGLAGLSIKEIKRLVLGMPH